MRKAVLITGCSTGIGRATALAFARAGLPTYASARRLETIEDLAAAGCRLLQLDVTDEVSMARAVATVEAEWGSVGALINNAGYAESAPLEEVTMAAIQRQFDTNVFGLLRLCQLVLPRMRELGTGTIVNVGSIGGLITAPAAGAYPMTKYALEALSDALRIEVRGFGIHVVLLEPDGVRTQFPVTAAATTPRAVPGPYDRLKDSHSKVLASSYRDGARGLLSPEAVADVAVRAVTSTRPRARYRIGLQARFAPALRRLAGDRGWDSLMARMFPA
ncbi:SDR family NAD(P)-dependent oxidoreductase [Dactylosporangium sp. NPDC005572]|uniref:SDR family NAD(P)-dependent oxidoreductase n=1 Tax=Dactylosporangium sp. NPDC005572 TaxID=3156889 RepID=UPI0033AB54E6